MTSHSIEGLSDGGLREITMQDVRLAVGEGKLTNADVLAGCNAELRRRLALSAAPERVGGGGMEGSSSSSPSPAASAKSQPNGEHQVYEARLQLQDHQQQLDADGVMVGVSREALDILLRHFSEAWNELHCCDDVALSEGLVGGIADLGAQRDYWRGLGRPAEPKEASASSVLIAKLADALDVVLSWAEETHSAEFPDFDELVLKARGIPFEPCASEIQPDANADAGGDGVPVHSSLPPAEPESQASPPIGAEGGKPTSAGVSGCGEVRIPRKAGFRLSHG